MSGPDYRVGEGMKGIALSLSYIVKELRRHNDREDAWRTACTTSVVSNAINVNPDVPPGSLGGACPRAPWSLF